MRRQERRLPSEKELRQKAHELALFKRFCNIKPFDIVEGTLTQPPPPEPDIRVEIVGDGLIGFELVCIDEPAYLRALNLMPESARVLTDFYEHLSTDERAAFDERYRDAMLHLHFVDTAGQRGVRRSDLMDFGMSVELSTKGFRRRSEFRRIDESMHLKLLIFMWNWWAVNSPFGEVTRWSRVAISGGHSELSPIRFPQWVSADVS